MYRFSFKIKHNNCEETKLSIDFPKHYISVIDIQSKNPKDKQYLYHISGDSKYFDKIKSYLNNSRYYKLVKEIERTKNILIVVLHQKSYIQNIIQENNGFFIDLHTVYDGYEFWHVGVVEKYSIERMRKELSKLGKLKILSIGEVNFYQPLLTKQQEKIFVLAHKSGYYKIPRKTTIKQIAHELKLSPSTVGEHLIKSEIKLINSAANKI
ncbi:helix-turn-helix domain-containing protein [Candidatus Woesearchaeota archaeon]|nr:helix-turn-helix domain-containing protein [Candidatus Woesearchaeota archaeon]